LRGERRTAVAACPFPALGGGVLARLPLALGLPFAGLAAALALALAPVAAAGLGGFGGAALRRLASGSLAALPAAPRLRPGAAGESVSRPGPSPDAHASSAPSSGCGWVCVVSGALGVVPGAVCGGCLCLCVVGGGGRGGGGLENIPVFLPFWN